MDINTGVDTGSLIHSRVSLRGIKRGWVGSSTITVTKCVVICKDLPTFIISSMIRQHLFIAVVIFSETSVTTIRSVCEGDTLICTMKNASDGIIVAAANGCSVALIDTTINSTICSWLLGAGIKSFISTTQPRRLHKSWKRSSVILSHEAFGGVTDKLQQFSFCTQESFIRTNNIDKLRHSRDAFTIIDDSVWCQNKRRRPQLDEVVPLRTVNVGSEKFPIFHIKGLLPCQDILHCRIISPAIGLKKNMWGIRRLTTGELMDALDISQDFIQTLTDIKQACGSNIIPAGVWFAAVCMFLPIETSIEEITPTLKSKRVRISTDDPPALGIHENDILSKLTILQEDQGAVKSDDAEINTVLWLDHLVDGGDYFLFRLCLEPI